MKEKFCLAIVITVTLSCLQNWSMPTANRLKNSSQTEAQHIASLWIETLP
ncbi:MAG: hypothetical protein KME10_00295 [Plectolyngbya sp. WJT66-NPBG17]|nr:hypothetical protein [Plectolyngbya sp. WJT66-NPBG17]MBW4523618.1 hypothetical protein [Phormidium tanganyikae FI6-MK23]